MHVQDRASCPGFFTELIAKFRCTYATTIKRYSDSDVQRQKEAFVLTSSGDASSSLCERAGSEPSRCYERGSESSFSDFSGSPSSLTSGSRSSPELHSCRPHSQPPLPHRAVPLGLCWGRCGTSALSADWTGCPQSQQSAAAASVEKR